jgi:diphthamide biosynthesis methyltransferase
MKPSNSRVVLGDNATFYCQFPGTDVSIEWKVNNVSLSEYMDVNINNQIRQNASGSVHTLTILALKSYNETTVKCSARILPSECHRRQEVESDTVNLLIQGR